MTKFKLSDKFLTNYEGKQPSWGFGDLSYLVYKRTYSRIMENGQQEEWFDTVKRVVEGCFNIQKDHCEKVGLPWDAYRAQKSAQKMFEKIWEFKFTPPGRGLWICGTSVVEEKGGAALNNCFSGETEFLTSDGAVKLQDAVGNSINVLTKDGKFTNANVKSFGKQILQKITLRPFGVRSNYRITYDVTQNHRWILDNNEQTTTLKIGDKLKSQINLSEIDTKSYELGKVHGVIFGDGTRHTYYPDRFMIRLCDKKTQELQGILEDHPGYVSTTCVGGDPFITIRSKANFKGLPGWDNRTTTVDYSFSYIKGFVEGWLTADSHVGAAKHYTSYTLDSINSEAIEWLKRHAALAGYSVVGHNVETSDTNFGPRNYPLQRLTIIPQAVTYIVEDIQLLDEQTVYCVEEPTTHTFTLAYGILTGNCGFFSSENIGKDFGEPFSWAADMLMLGVGIGYDTRGANKLLIKQPTGKPTTYQIPDTREGWAEAVRLLIDSFDGRSRTPVEFDYTLVRAAGEPIKGFGGTASGPEPLREGLESIRNLLTEHDSQYVTSVVITDIVNFIGKFVVAGNVRRSATISFSNDTDRDFIEMKDPTKFSKELMDRRWVSNNSVFAGVETDFASLENNINTNGEPGLFFLDNARHYGRFKDGYYPENHPYFDNCIGSNPCVTKDTWILTSKGPRQVYELLDQNNIFIVNGKEYSGTNFWSTGVKKTFRLTTSEGYSLKLTDNHKLLTTKGWLEAKDLILGDRLLLNKHKNLSWTGEGTSDEGYLIGSLLGDGTFANGKPILAVWEDGGHESVMSKIEEIMFKLPHRSDFKGFNTIDIATCNVLTHRAILASFKPIANKFGMFQGNKTITSTIEKASSDFYRGFLKGLFDADGSVQGTQQKGISIRLSQVSVSCLEAVQRMLLRLGIKSVIYPRTEAGNRLLPDGKGGQKEYFCQKSYDLIISNDCILEYNQKIGFVNSVKQEKLNTLISQYKRTPNKTLFEVTFDQLIPQEDEEVFDATVEDVHRFDANGLVAHNCVEQLLEDRELCTLVETYPARHKNAEEYFETLKYAYLYAKSVTLVPTHSKHTNAVMLKNRRIGVSQSGIQQALKKFGHATYFKRFCDEAYGILRNWDKIYSRWLGIPTSIRVSSIKPSGTVSLLTGSTPGVHCTHSEYYFRTVRMAANSSLLPNLIKANYRIEYAVTDTEKIKNCMSPTELDSTSILIADLSKETLDKFKNIGGTVVIYFPIKEENFTKSKYDISIWEQMSLVRELQHNWADNCVSVTVTIKPEEKKDLVDAIRFFAPYIKALSFLPLDNHGYAQAPYTTCTKEEYEQYKASLRPLTFKKSKSEAKGERFCTTDRCEV